MSEPFALDRDPAALGTDRGNGRDGSAAFTIVGIGASAGGLDACTKFMAAVMPRSGMAFVLVQHLDPHHESMMVDLLASHTSVPVRQAEDGMRVEIDTVYVIPPGAYLSIVAGALHLSKPQSRHGARLPFDFLLHSLAEECGVRAIAVILSGTGSDGTLGLRSVKRQGGLAVAQDPEEATHDGMPRSAVLSGEVDMVLPAADIPPALVTYDRRMTRTRSYEASLARDLPAAWLPMAIELLRTRTAHDFTLYKPGTLQRRIERRMAMAAIETDGMPGYLAMLYDDPHELDRVAKDLLINVTGFFRDAAVFDVLADGIVPDLVRNRAPDHPLRIWIAGCSTGQEAYSLAILFREALTAAGLHLKLQVFASDVDPDAVALARDGLYPDTIEAEVSPARLARFFSKEDRSYRIRPEVRADVVFTVQDLLADPPFSRLDLVSCRNLLIYLGPEAQARVLSLFHFALRQDGILLLGNSETAGPLGGRFEVISKSARLYRHIGRSRPGEIGFATIDSHGSRPRSRAEQERPSRQAALAELCRRLVMEAYAPAAVLINQRYDCLYSLGQTHRYLRTPPGYPTHDLLAMVPEALRSKVRSAVQQAVKDQVRIVVAGGRTEGQSAVVSYGVAVQPVERDGETLVLICFIDEPPRQATREGGSRPRTSARVAELEEEIAGMRIDLRDAIRSLELSAEEQRAINEETLSVNEEYQSTNEELLTSKEELQSLNEELTALNSQLQETLERQRTTADDLQNVLYSTDVATLFLDPNLKIRFFTPATKALFSVIPGDIGRPLADLNPLAADSRLQADARTVLRTLSPIEREIETEAGIWFLRRILPYLTHDRRVEGVVITFTDITERKLSARALEAARHEAEQANRAKSRFLAAASHDLRQPLQSLVLLQGLLTKAVHDEGARKLVGRIDQTLGTMAGMLNALLDINQIEAGIVRADIVEVPVHDLLARLRDDFGDMAQAQQLDLRIVPCSLVISSDPRLLEQMIRNLVSNALKYTKRGKVLIGCRRRPGGLSIEVWDTGVGIPDAELDAIFGEYHQLDNAARDRSRGLGLGLSIVQRLGQLLGHKVRVASRLGQGSVFAIDIARRSVPPPLPLPVPPDRNAIGPASRQGTILVVEDDDDLRDLLQALLEGEGHRTATAADGPAALDLVARGGVGPDLILADYNLPNGMDGLEVAARLRNALNRQVPIVILTGDISIGALREISAQKCAQLSKPVRVGELTRAIETLLAEAMPGAGAQSPRAAAPHAGAGDVIYVVDDDPDVRATIRSVLEEDGRIVEDYESGEAYLADYRQGRGACLLVDAYLPGMTGLDLIQRLHQAGDRLPAIMITGNSDVPMAVQAMKAGASNFIEKPVSRSDLLACIAQALEQRRDAGKLFAWRDAAAEHVAGLTPRQRQIMGLVLAGHPSKNIAADLGISQRTVENHRASIMRKTGSDSLPALARLALAAAWSDPVDPLA